MKNCRLCGKPIEVPHCPSGQCTWCMACYRDRMPRQEKR